MAKGGYRGPMGGGMNMNMIKQAQKMQQDMLKMQEEMEAKEYEATSGGGMVVAAVNEAMRKAEAEASQSMAKLTGGLNLGGLF